MPHGKEPSRGGREEQEKSYDESKVSDAATEMDRRTLLKTASAAAVGGAGLAATTGSAAAGELTSGECSKAAAPNDFSRVSTRDHFDDDSNLINGESAWSYDVEGTWDKWGDDLALLVHGWNSDDAEDTDIDHGYELQLALEQEGWGGESAVFTWDSDKGGWGDAKDTAEKNGRKLANFTQWYSRTYGANVRWVCHSLGARVAIFGLQSLDDDYGLSNQVKSVSLVGGAIENDDPAMDAGWWDDEYGDHIEFATEQFGNFYAEDDAVLQDLFETYEIDGALGAEGIEGTPPDNYTDYNVTDIVPTHYDYNTRYCGCVTQVYNSW